MDERSLANRLKALGVHLGTGNLPVPRPVERKVPYPVEMVVPGRFQPTSTGPIYIAERAYPADFEQGNNVLRPRASMRGIANWARNPEVELVTPEGLAFLDTETTGLAGGTGTYAFLVGVARFEGDTFRLAQFFMRDPAEEPALLEALSGFLFGCSTLVTFNGKAFDAPLLNTRYTLHAVRSPLRPLAHLDLLLLARRLWRRRLPSRSLGSLETDILGMSREAEDVPGWLIPDLYFRYLQTGDARPLAGVFYHNAEDIVSLAALLNLMSRWLDAPLEHIEEALDIVSAAGLFEDLGQKELSCRLYEKSLAVGLPPGVHEQTVLKLSLLRKQTGDVEDAVELWIRAAGDRQLYAFVELAKYYEHRCKDFAAAERWTVAGLETVERSNLPRYERREWREQLEHRLNRVRRKMGSGQAQRAE